MRQYSFFRVHLIVNTAQISINFSAEMLSQIAASPCLDDLMSRLGSQLLVTEIFCPFISFQAGCLPPDAEQVIEASDAVYVKGANFFETLQIENKNTFYAFVVTGPISQAFTGLSNLEGVFAFVPEGDSGYVAGRGEKPKQTLWDSVGQSETSELVQIGMGF